MARQVAQPVRRTATRAGLRSQVQRYPADDGSRARDTYRRRYHRGGVGIAPSPPHGRRLIDRVTYEDGGGVQGDTGVRGAQAPGRLARGRRLIDRMTFDDSDGDGDVRGARARANTAIRRDNTMSSEARANTGVRRGNIMDTQARGNNTASQATQGAQGNLLVCNPRATQAPAPSLAPVPQPRTAIRPIRLLNQPVGKPSKSPTGNNENESSDEHVAARAPTRPRNTYKGKDKIKRAVQNPKLRAILAGRRLPRPRRKHNEPVLRMGLRDRVFYDL